MKRILLFLIKFLVISIILGVVWYAFVHGYYLKLICGSWNVFYKVSISDKKVNLSANILSFYFKDESTGSMALFMQIDGKSLTFNIIPLIALFLSNPGIGIKRRMLTLSIGLIIIYSSHLLHIKLDFYRVMPIEKIYLYGGFWFKVEQITRFFWHNTLKYSGIFYEQVGSQLMPLILWMVLQFREFRSFFPQKAPPP